MKFLVCHVVAYLGNSSFHYSKNKGQLLVNGSQPDTSTQNNPKTTQGPSTVSYNAHLSNFRLFEDLLNRESKVQS